MTKYDLVIVANSPGELSALVKPVAETFSEQVKDARIILVLTPCQYTSGKETEYSKGIKGIEEIITSAEYRNWILLNKKPPITFAPKGAVIYLGGDLAHAMLVAKKVNYPAYAYVQDRVIWARFYKKFFVPDEPTRAKLAKNKYLKEKIKSVGNLMVDSVRELKPWQPQKKVITFLPGSRDWQIHHTTPIYEKIIAEIKRLDPSVTIQLVSSPFKKAHKIEGAKTIEFEDTYNSELVITIPGTNTARLAALGIPMLVVFPLDNPDVIPIDGLGNYICKIPYLGSKLKKSLAESINKRTKFFALPNIKAGRAIVEEIRGKIYPVEVASKALLLLSDEAKLKQMSKNLLESMGKPGAALKITEEINEALRSAL